MLSITPCRPTHVGYLQVLHDDDSLVFADLVADLVQVVVSTPGDFLMDPCYPLLLFTPVVGKFNLMRQFALRSGQLLLNPPEAVQGFV